MALYSQSQQQYLLDAINKANPDAVLPADLSNCTIGKPRAIAQKKPGDPNTEITIRGRQRRGYNGSQTFRYTRLSLSDLFKNISPVITLPGISYMQQAVKNINGRYGLNLLPEEVINYYFYNQSYQTLTTNGESLQWTGSVRMRYTPGKWDLEEQVMTNVLPVMEHPVAPKDAKKCATMLAYGIDFTEEYALLNAFTTGTMGTGANFSTGRSQSLVDMMVSHGLPSWSFVGARAQIKNTASETRANKAFDRVLVISSVDDPDVAGDWLLHYNI